MSIAQGILYGPSRAHAYIAEISLQRPFKAGTHAGLSWGPIGRNLGLDGQASGELIADLASHGSF